MKIRWGVAIAALLITALAGGVIGLLGLGKAGLAISFLAGAIIQVVAIVKFRLIELS